MRGFAFVRYYKKAEAEEAERKLDSATLDGRVDLLTSPESHRPRLS